MKANFFTFDFFGYPALAAVEGCFGLVRRKMKLLRFYLSNVKFNCLLDVFFE